jgi:protein SCO1/2
MFSSQQSRRRKLLALGIAALLPRAAYAHAPLGPIDPPLAAPALPLTLHDGSASDLPRLLKGRWTALQLMFTGCSATCPIQGAVFANLQSKLATSLPQAQLLSVSIDPLNDTAAALAAWRQRFGAQSLWLAAAPAIKHANVLLDFLDGRASGSDRHTTQTLLFDSQARFVFRCAEFASASDIARLMQQMARR